MPELRFLLDADMPRSSAEVQGNSILFVNEAVGENWREYSYHWQRESKIRRWDNAPHHKELPIFPHHLHDENDILSCEDVNLIDVLMYIETEIGKNAPQHPDPSSFNSLPDKSAVRSPRKARA